MQKRHFSVLPCMNDLKPVYAGAIVAPCHRRTICICKTQGHSCESCWMNSDVVVVVVVVVVFCLLVFFVF